MDEIRRPLPVDRLEAAHRAEHLRNLLHVARKRTGEGACAERATRGPNAGAFRRSDAEVELPAQLTLEDGADVARVPAAAVLVRMKVSEQNPLHGTGIVGS